MNLNTPRIDDGRKLRAVELTAHEADAHIKTLRRPLPFEDSIPVIDYTKHTSECANTGDDLDAARGIVAGVVLSVIVGALLVALFVTLAALGVLS
jgi:hypothetical protein